VYKVYEKNNPKNHYVIKSYKTREEFEREAQMLKELSDAKVCTWIVLIVFQLFLKKKYIYTYIFILNLILT
jgi:hypothetical protein